MLCSFKTSNLVNLLCPHFRRFYSIRSELFKSPKIDRQFIKNPYEREWEVVEQIDETINWFKFTIASYNVLSQNLLDSNKRLYKMCHPRFLTWHYRKEVLKREFAFHQPDILCLQEVHFQEFSQFFVPELQKLGYFGLYKKRTSAKEDGCATFFKHEKFQLEAFKYMEYHHKDIAALNPDNVALIFLLKPCLTADNADCGANDPKSDCELHSHQTNHTSQAKKRLEDFKLCVANTHLLFNPTRGEVKLAQLMTLMAGIDELNCENKYATLLCGDFNSVPNSGLYTFAHTGRVECKEVNSKFFSGQLKPSPEELKNFHLKNALSPMFLDRLTSLTDQCQFVEAIKKRKEKNKDSFNSNDDDHDNSGLSARLSYTQGSGIISHNLDLEPVYDHSAYNDSFPYKKEVSFFIEVNCSKVDYIFYSQTDEQKRQRKMGISASSKTANQSLNEIVLLKRLKLFTEAEVRSKFPQGMPNKILGSDHMILMAEFGLKLDV